MKLIITVVDDQDVEKVMAALNQQRVGVTRVSSTGGLLSPGNSTLMIGLDEAKVEGVMKTITELASPHPGVVPYAHAGSMPLTSFIEVEMGGFVSFVLDIDHFEQV